MASETINERTQTTQAYDPSSGGACDDYKLYKYPGGWFKVTGQFTIDGSLDFWAMNVDSRYEFAVFPEETGQMVECTSDFDCVDAGFASGWCCSEQSSMYDLIEQNQFYYCNPDDWSITQNHCMTGQVTAYTGTDEEHSIFVWAMHFNNMDVSGGNGSISRTSVFVRDNAYFNRTKTKTKKVLVTDNKQTLHYKKIRSKPLPKVSVSSARRSKQAEDRLLASGYTCEQIGGCYHQ